MPTGEQTQSERARTWFTHCFFYVLPFCFAHFSSIQTWDGVLQGQRLLTMSCSDKIARWNVLGLQGALLSSVVQPIYLHSIVLGSLLHPNHMYRAICGRLEKAIQGLPPPYRLNKPKLALVTSSEARCQLKPPNYSINWTAGQAQIEIINSFTGKTVCNKISRLTKQCMFQRFAKVVQKLPMADGRSATVDTADYADVKANVINYQVSDGVTVTASTQCLTQFVCFVERQKGADQRLSARGAWQLAEEAHRTGPVPVAAGLREMTNFTGYNFLIKLTSAQSKRVQNYL